MSNAHIANPEAAPTKTTLYYVTAKGINGCISNDSIDIKVTGGELNGKNYLLPSAFTPNGDGLNDFFKPIVKCFPTKFSFSIYDRFGHIIYQTSEYQSKGWNGKIKRDDASQGVYLWTLTYKEPNKNLEEKKYGTVILIK